MQFGTQMQATVFWTILGPQLDDDGMAKHFTRPSILEHTILYARYITYIAECN